MLYFSLRCYMLSRLFFRSLFIGKCNWLGDLIFIVLLLVLVVVVVKSLTILLLVYNLLLSRILSLYLNIFVLFFGEFDYSFYMDAVFLIWMSISSSFFWDSYRTFSRSSLFFLDSLN